MSQINLCICKNLNIQHYIFLNIKVLDTCGRAPYRGRAIRDFASLRSSAFAPDPSRWSSHSYPSRKQLGYSRRNIVQLKTALIAILALFAIALNAQTDLPDESVQVIKNFNARLQETEILSIPPTVKSKPTKPKPQTYNVKAQSIQVEYLPPKIRPLAYKRAKNQKVYNGYAKLGAGLPNSVLGEAGYSLFKDDQFDVNVHGKFHTANNNKQIENQQFTKSFLKGSGNYYFNEGFAVGARAAYTRNKIHYYGYNFDKKLKERGFAADQVLQRFAITDLGASIFNGVQTIGDINYGADLDFYYLRDEYAARENGTTLNFHFTKWFAEKHPLAIRLITDFNSYRDSTKQNLNNFFLQPNFTFVNEFFRFKAGINLISNNDEYSFYPQLEATVPVLGPRLTVFVGADGGLQKNTFRTLSTYNPFIKTYAGIDLRNTQFTDYYGGIKGIYAGFEYLGRVGYKNVKDLALYNPDYTEINDPDLPRYVFNTIYDDGTIFYLKGSISAPIFKGFTIIGDATSSIYSMENESRAWHLPALAVSGTLKYITLKDKVTVKASTFIESGVNYLTETGKEESLSGLFDISLGAQYQVTKNFGLFLDIYNLANNKRVRWYNYPTYGINVLVGASAKF